MKKWVILSIYILTAVMLFLFRDPVSEWLHTTGTWIHHLTVFLIAFIVALVPAIPYGIVAALFGAKYGTLSGALINLAISSMAAAAMFLLVRYAFSPDQRRKAAEMKAVSHLTAFAERNPFFAVLFARLLPIVPAQAVNIYAAVTRMTLLPYLTATVIGKVPFIFTVTLVGNQVLQSFEWKAILQIALIYGLFLLIVGSVYKMIHMKQKTG